MKRIRACLAIAALAICAPGVIAENIDPAGDASQYAWGENVGWISAEQDTDGDTVPDRGVQVDDFLLTGWMWGENVGWISLSCLTGGNCAGAPYSVVNDGNGGLRGWAWGENVGWISFTCENTASCDTIDYGVTIDVTTGEFAGYAWGEGVGWIKFDFADPTIRPHRIETAWRCDPSPPPPSGTPLLAVEKLGDGVSLVWSVPSGATGYDIVQGDLGTLRVGGDYTAAVDRCVADDYPLTSRGAFDAPGPGDGVWYLLRGANCGGFGTYDTGLPSQTASRDEEIAASGSACD